MLPIYGDLRLAYALLVALGIGAGVADLGRGLLRWMRRRGRDRANG